MSCPVVDEFDPLSAEFEITDPYPLLEKLQAEHRVFYASALDMYVLTRREDIVWALSNSEGDVFSAGNASSPVCPVANEAQQILADGGFRRLPTLTNADPPRHDHIGPAVRQCMSAGRLRKLEPRLRTKAEELIDAMLAKPVADLVVDLAFPLPAYAGLGLLGFPEEDFERIKSWVGNRVLLTYGRLSPGEQCAAARDVVTFWQYVERFVATRTHTPQDDFTSDLIELAGADPDGPTADELVSVVYSIALAGHETTTNLITNAMLAILRRPEVWRRLCEQPALAVRATEEALRYDSPVSIWRRRAAKDVIIGDVTIPAGAQVAMLFGVANRDPEKFSDAEEFIADRFNAGEHLSFGKGRHYCKGAPLARLEMKICLELLADKAPGLHLVEGPAADDYPRNLSFRGPRRLLVSAS